MGVCQANCVVCPSAAGQSSGAGRGESRLASATGGLPPHRARPKLQMPDRVIRVWLSRWWSDWRSVLVIVQPATVVGWHRQLFRLYWRWKSRGGKSGRPQAHAEIRNLIRRMSRDNPLWGSAAHSSRIEAARA